MLLQTAIRFNIDTGSQVDLMDLDTFKRIKNSPRLKKCNTTLYGYNSRVPLEVEGEFTTRVQYGNNQYGSVKFIVKTGKAGSLLSYATSVKLGILQKIGGQVNNIKQSATSPELNRWKAKYPGVFAETIGLFRGYEATLHIDESVQPRQEKLRHVHFHLRERVEAEIKAMLEEDLIEPVPGPTPWISPIVPVPKRNGTDEIRICTNAPYANKAIKRERHVTPTVDDIIVKLNGAKFISKIDLKKGYNQIGIATQCRYITAFCIHMGIYQYKRLNFGINTAAEVFQKAIESIICGIQGTLNISDDIIISGSTLEEHDDRLDRTLSSLQKAGITVNEKKCVFAATELDFFGMHFSDTGVSIQESKIDALLNARPPSTPGELRSLLGLANYCSRFIPNLATLVYPLRQLTRASAKWEWTATHDDALNKLKDLLTKDAVSYFDPKLKSRVVVDASPVGLVLVHL